MRACVLEKSFATHGVPNTFISDNSPPYNSDLVFRSSALKVKKTPPIKSIEDFVRVFTVVAKEKMVFYFVTRP